jgi:hypothetical protein
MQYLAALKISFAGGSQTSFFGTVEEASQVLDEFCTQLAAIKEYSNRDEKPIFRYKGSGALYAVDLRKCASAVVEILEEWQDVATEGLIRDLNHRRKFKAAAEDHGLTPELKEVEGRDRVPAVAA